MREKEKMKVLERGEPSFPCLPHAMPCHASSSSPPQPSLASHLFEYSFSPLGDILREGSRWFKREGKERRGREEREASEKRERSLPCLHLHVHAKAAQFLPLQSRHKKPQPPLPSFLLLPIERERDGHMTDTHILEVEERDMGGCWFFFSFSMPVPAPLCLLTYIFQSLSGHSDRSS